MPRLPSNALWNEKGSMAIETAIVAPVLILASVGAFQASSVVARQQELQSGAADIEAIIMAANLNTGNAISSSDIKNVIKTQLGLTDSQVTLTVKYRCGTATTFVDASSSCTGGAQAYKYIKMELTDTYTPGWTKFGVGSAINFNVSRSIQVN